MTISDAIRTWDTQGPLQSYLSAFQTIDSSNRDWTRIAQTAVAQAESQKANNFNQMMARLKYHNLLDQQERDMDLKKQELALRQEQFDLEKSFLERGLNPRTGAPAGRSSSSANYNVAPPGVTVTPGDDAALPYAEYIEADDSTPGLFPTIPGGYSMTGEDGEPPREPEAAEDTTEAQEMGPTLPSFSRTAEATLEIQQQREAEDVNLLQNLIAEQKRLEREIYDAPSQAQRARMDPEYRQAWESEIAKKQKQLGEVTGLLNTQKADTAKSVKERAPIKERAEILREIAPLEDVLPPGEVARLANEAVAKSPPKSVVEDLRTLQEYSRIRDAEGWDHKSKGVRTAKALVQAYNRANEPRSQELRIRAEEFNRLEDAVRYKEAEIKGLTGAERAALEDSLEEDRKNMNALRGDAVTFKGIMEAYDRALKADIRVDRTKMSEATLSVSNAVNTALTGIRIATEAMGRSTGETETGTKEESSTNVSRGAAKYFSR